MEGYHGTKPDSVDSILASNSFTISQFVIGGDFTIPSNQSLPNDLGQGLYLFVDDDIKGYNGLDSAKNYARIYRSNSQGIGVICFKIDCEKLKVLDLSEPDSIRFLNMYKEKCYGRIENSLKRFKSNRALKRFNLDGIFLEHILRYHPTFKSMNAVVYDSYISTTSENPRPLSFIPNAREFCLRDTNLIDWMTTKEVYRGI